MKEYCTAAEAAEILGLDYHTFMARVRRGLYKAEEFGRQKAFDRVYIEQTKNTPEEKSCC